MLPPIDVPIKPYLTSLKELSNAGNAYAACRVAWELLQCNRVDGLKSLADRDLKKSQAGDLSPEQKLQLSLRAENSMGEYQRTAKVCEGVGKDEATQAWRYALQGARTGHVPSMILYLTIPPIAQQPPDPDAMAAFNAEAHGFLEKALDAGYPEAFYIATNALARGDIWKTPIPKDPVRALAIKFALKEVTLESLQDDEDLGITLFIRDMKLSETEIAQARRQANPMAAKMLSREQPRSLDIKATLFRFDASQCEFSN
ncbi:MAG: hypothetical protein ING75_16470 [Rhodocyclaceae bacterium]|nr:hypothetical protein [Rhodocyclaceae bacterium]